MSDPALLLAARLEAAFGIGAGFVVLNSNERCSVPYPASYCSPEKLLEACAEIAAGRPAAILVHVSGYGYSADGAPAHLASALETVKASGQFPVAAYFHENFATGPPWRSAFWHNRRQKQALRRIIAQCGLIVTNTSRHAGWLARESQILGGVQVEQIPVFSTAGETDTLGPFNARNPAMVVFGLAGTRKKAYQKLEAVGELVRHLGIQEILDIGPEINPPSEVSGVRVKRIGWLSTEELRSAFSSAQFGFVTHDWFCLGKSSVFASYCAQGTIPVLPGSFPEEADGLKDGVHVVSPRSVKAVGTAGWEACSQAAWDWYRGHNLQVHAARYAKWLGRTA